MKALWIAPESSRERPIATMAIPPPQKNGIATPEYCQWKNGVRAARKFESCMATRDHFERTHCHAVDSLLPMSGNLSDRDRQAKSSPFGVGAGIRGPVPGTQGPITTGRAPRIRCQRICRQTPDRSPPRANAHGGRGEAAPPTHDPSPPLRGGREKHGRVPRTLCSAPQLAAWCAADPGSIWDRAKCVSRLCGAALKRCTASGTRDVHSHGAGLSIAISSSTSMRGRTTAY